MPSIYRRICDEFAKTRSLPYGFMPPEIGANSLRSMLATHMPADFRRICARSAWNTAMHGGKWSVVEPIWFAEDFRREALTRIAAGEITREAAAAVGRRMATDSDRVEAVEIGMLLMGLARDDLTEMIMERLALHAKFTSVAIIACRDWPRQNERIFRWLRSSCDCGAVMCALALKPETDEQRRWLFENGLKVGNPKAEMARCILMRPGMLHYIRNLPDTPENFHALCRLAAYMPQAGEGAVALLALKLLPGMEYADSYIDLCAIHRMQRVLLQPAHELYDEWEKHCAVHRQRLLRCGVIGREMDNPREDAALLCLVLTGEDMTPSLERLKPVLAAQDMPDAMLRFLLLYHADVYARDLLELLLQAAPPEVFSGAIEDVPEQTPEDSRYDMWLAAALSSMSGSVELREADVLRCLSARSVRLRAAAVSCLEIMSGAGLSAAAEKALSAAIAQESSDMLKDRMQRQRHGANPSRRVRRRIALPERLDVIALENCRLSDSLGTVEIIGRKMYNIDGAAGMLRDGSRLLLAPMPGEPGFALAVTPGGIVVGEAAFEPGDETIARMCDEGVLLVAEMADPIWSEQLTVEIYRPLHALTIPAKQSDVGKIRMFPIRK